MGMFDYVKGNMVCPNCGEIVCGFQTKDSSCCLDTLSPEDEDIYNFYTSCDKCGTWIDIAKKIQYYCRYEMKRTEDEEDKVYTTIPVEINIED